MPYWKYARAIEWTIGSEEGFTAPILDQRASRDVLHCRQNHPQQPLQDPQSKRHACEAGRARFALHAR